MNNQSKILLVDDDPGMIDTLEAILKDKYAVIKSSDGETALKLMDKEDINVAILDIRLPGIDGIEVLKHIKDRHEDIEAIMISAVKDIKIAVSAMKMGAYDYIIKPVELSVLSVSLERALEKRNLIIQNRINLVFIKPHPSTTSFFKVRILITIYGRYF